MEAEIKKTLEDIRPALARHMGDIEFVRFEKGVVYVKMLGMCHGCPLSEVTLKAGIEEILKSRIQGVKEVRALAPHQISTAAYDSIEGQ